MGAYDRVYYNGKLFNKRTVAMLKEVERRLGHGLTYYQGSYNSGVGASAGTHDGGGAVDLYGSDPDQIVRVMRQVGFAAWKRNPSQGPWPYHIHGIAIADKQMSSGARVQVVEYYNGYDGLAGSGRDYHWRPSPIPVFHYYAHQVKVIDISRVLRQMRMKGKRRVMGVEQVQRGLNANGHHLVVDGKAGPKTQNAFRAYRTKHNLGPIRAVRRLGKGRYRTRK